MQKKQIMQLGENEKNAKNTKKMRLHFSLPPAQNNAHLPDIKPLWPGNGEASLYAWALLNPH